MAIYFLTTINVFIESKHMYIEFNLIVYLNTNIAGALSGV